MHSIRLPYSLCLATLLALNGAGVMSATLVSYDNLSAWEADTNPGFGLIEFEITSSYISYNDSAGYSTGGVQFIGVTNGSPPYELTVVDGGVVGHNYGSGDVLKGPLYKTNPPRSFVQVNLPADITSFGVDLGAYDGSGATAPQNFTIRIGLTEFAVTTVAQPGLKFFGLTSSDPIPTVDLILETGGALTKPIVDNVRFGTASAGAETPEPGTYLLVGAGLVAIGVYRRRNGGAVGS